MKTSFQITTFSLTLSVLITSAIQADEWPFWMGPKRDNTWNEDGILDKFPEGGPKILWRTPIKSGYSGPAVSKGKVVISDFVTEGDFTQANFQRTELDGVERVICLDEKTGKIIWKHELKITYSISYPAGPRCTPVIEGDRVYTLGAEGNLFCFKLDDGSLVWEKDLRKTYKTKSALWGYAAHPLIDGDNLITLAGGEGSHVVALNKNTGEEVWRSLNAAEQGYSPPTIIEAAGVRQLILTSPEFIASVNPANGKPYWSVKYEATSGSIIMTPTKIGDYLFVAGYSNKSTLLKLDTEKPGAKVVWTNKARDVVSPVNVQPYFDDETGIMYGLNQTGDLRASQFPDGKLLWETIKPVSERKTGNGTAFIVRQADRFWLFNDSGELIIAKMDKSGYTEIDRAKVIEPTNKAFNRPVVWSMPAFANKHAYVRNDEEIICIDLAK